jgi:hypothetical protein
VANQVRQEGVNHVTIQGQLYHRMV